MTTLLFVIYAILSLGFLGSYAYFIFVRKDLHTREREFDRESRGHSVMVNRKTREWWLWITTPIEDYFYRKQIEPNTISWIGFWITAFSCVGYSMGWVVIAGWCVLLGGTLDIFDGKIARRLKRESQSGDYMDANLDRMSEALMYLGLLNFYANQLFFYVVFVAFASAQLVSYSKARGEKLGIKMEGVGLMQRPERIVWIGVPSALSPLLAALVNTWIPLSQTWLASVGITVVAMLSAYTYYERYQYIHQELKKRDAA